MSDRARYLELSVSQDLNRKMVFIGGPRQVGKTTLARRISAAFHDPAYLNWDNSHHRLAIKNARWKPETDLLTLDEIHKFPRWKNLIKGIWDTRDEKLRLIVTGSSRLDIFRRGGDSLQGRYHFYRLHPFSLREMNNLPPPSVLSKPDFTAKPFPDPLPGMDKLLRWGGFPEPLFSNSDRLWRRWRRERFERVFREDIRDVEAIRALGQLELLATMLPDRVCSPLSVNSLCEDVETSPKTMKAWLDLLCRNYYLFRVPPWHRRIDRALKKESKYYFWDWSEAPEGGPRFENLVACHLLKWCHYVTDAFGWRVDLYYVRDREKRETDFLLAWEQTPLALVECKLRDAGSNTPLKYFAGKLGLSSAFLVTLDDTADYLDRAGNIRVIPAARFLAGFA